MLMLGLGCQLRVRTVWSLRPVACWAGGWLRWIRGHVGLVLVVAALLIGSRWRLLGRHEMQVLADRWSGVVVGSMLEEAGFDAHRPGGRAVLLCFLYVWFGS